MADFIATLVAPKGLEPRVVSCAAALLRGEAGPVRDGVAVDVRFDFYVPPIAGVGPDWVAMRRLRNELIDATDFADVFIQPEGLCEKRLLIADMDSTMITCECIDELADYAGIKAEIAAITERAMRGELDFAAALAERVALLAGLSESVIEQCLAERVRATPGAETLVRTLSGRGVRTVLVSGGFTRFAEPVGAMIGFDRVVANVLEIRDGVLTGRVLPPIVDSATKLATLQAECAALGIDAADVLAIGDGANDVPMLEGAGLSIAYYGHEAARIAADAVIGEGDLTAILYALGVPKADWVI